MKKLYIQPAVEVETMETLDIIATSPNVLIESYTNQKIEMYKATEGDGSDLAKGNSLWGFEEDFDEEFD